MLRLEPLLFGAAVWLASCAETRAPETPAPPERGAATQPASAPLAADPPPRATETRQIARGAGRVEVGIIEGAPYRVDVPPAWNGGLLLFCHGYGGPPKPFDAEQANATAETFTHDGFAVAQSAYSEG